MLGNIRRRFLQLFLLIVSFFSPLVHSVLALNQPPTLYAQMILQSEVDRKARILEGRSTVQARYRAKVAERSTSTIILSERMGVPIQLIPSADTPKEEYRVSSASKQNVSGVDMEKVRATWLGWVNDVRVNAGVPPYSYDARMDRTADIWASVLRDRDERNASNVHRRNLSDSYYDFSKITHWFEDHGVYAKVVNRSTTTENVGFGSYACKDIDCTDEMIAAVRKTFDFFMSEKSYNGVHYRSLIQSNFTKIGFSVQVNTTSGRYYVVIHYITEFSDK